jgi:hypothetical protein
VEKTGNQWRAFDATHASADGKHFCEIGSFSSIEAARTAVEQSVFNTVESAKPKVRTAGS